MIEKDIISNFFVNISLVALGGAIGATARYLFTNLFQSLFPNLNGAYGTMLINIVGSLCMGVLMALLIRFPSPLSEELRIFFAVGILGSFTTFSTFSFNFISMYENGQTLEASIYALTSVIISILALFLGLQIVRTIFQ